MINKADIISLGEIKAQVAQFKYIMEDIYTIKDLKDFINSNIDDICKQDMYVEIKDSYGLEEFDVDKFKDTDILKFIRVENYENLDYPGIYPKTGKVEFDVFDKNVDEEYAFIEDATLENIDALYKETIKELEEDKER